MTAPELRAFVRGVLDGLAPDARTGIAQELLARAVKGHAGWKPGRPAQRIIDDAKSFAEAARVAGYADPADVSEHLRLGSRRSSPATMPAPEASLRRCCRRLLLRTSISASTSSSTKCSLSTRTCASRST